ncbi:MULTISPECIES: GTP-binding protein [Salipiger]
MTCAIPSPCWRGSLGAGKTTLLKRLIREPEAVAALVAEAWTPGAA